MCSCGFPLEVWARKDLAIYFFSACSFSCTLNKQYSFFSPPLTPVTFPHLTSQQLTKQVSAENQAMGKRPRHPINAKSREWTLSWVSTPDTQVRRWVKKEAFNFFILFFYFKHLLGNLFKIKWQFPGSEVFLWFHPWLCVSPGRSSSRNSLLWFAYSAVCTTRTLYAVS